MPSVVQAISISPSVIELQGARGEVISETFTIINTKTADQTYYLETVKFQASEDGGSPQFIPASEDHEGFPEWISFDSDSVIVPALSTGEVAFDIRIPTGTESGGHYAAVTVSTAPEEVIATNGAVIDAKAAVLLLLEVEGETDRQAALLDFVQTDKTAVQSSLEGTFEYRVQNQGNVHVQPEGEIRFEDVFGRVLLSVDANELGSRVLPDSTRTYAIEVVDGTEQWFELAGQQMQWFAIGPVSVVLDLSYGEELVLTDSIGLFLMPWQLITTVLGLFLVLWLVYFMGKKRR